MLTKELLKIMNFKNVKLCLIISILLASEDEDTVQQELETFQSILAKTKYNEIFFRSMKRISIKCQMTATRISFYLDKVDKEDQTPFGLTKESKEKTAKNDEDGSKFENSGIFFYNESINEKDDLLQKLDLGFYPDIIFLSNGNLKLMIAELSDESSFCSYENYKKENIKCHINGFDGLASCVFENDLPLFIKIEDFFSEGLKMYNDINNAFINKENNPYFANKYMIYPNLVNFDSNFVRIRFEILLEDEKEKINESIEKLKEMDKHLDSDSKRFKKYDFLGDSLLRYLLKLMSLTRYNININHMYVYKIIDVNEIKQRIFDQLSDDRMKELISKGSERLEKIKKRSEELTEPKISSKTTTIYYKLTSCSFSNVYKEDIFQHIEEQFDIFLCLCQILTKAQETRIFECNDEENFEKLQNFAEKHQKFKKIYTDLKQGCLKSICCIVFCCDLYYFQEEIFLQIQFFIDIHKSRMNSLLWKTNNLIFNEFIKVKKDKELTENTFQTIFSNLKVSLSIFSDCIRNIIDLHEFLEILMNFYFLINCEILSIEKLNKIYTENFLNNDLDQKEYEDFIKEIGLIDTSCSKNIDSYHLFAPIQNERLSHVMKLFLILIFNENSKSTGQNETENHKKDEAEISFKEKNKNTFDDIINEIDNIKSTFNDIEAFYEGKPISRKLKNDNKTKSNTFTLNQENEKAENDYEKELKAELEFLNEKKETMLNNYSDKLKEEEDKMKTELAKLETELKDLDDNFKKQEEKMNADSNSAQNIEEAKLDFKNIKMQEEKKIKDDYDESKKEKETEIKTLIDNYENLKKIYETTKTTEETNMKIKIEEFKRDKELIKLHDNIKNGLYQISLKIDHILQNFVFSEDNFANKIYEDIIKKKFELSNLTEGDHQSLLVIIKFVFDTLFQIFDSKGNCGHINNSFIILDINTVISDNQDLILKTCEELINFMNLEVITLSEYQKWIKIWYKIDINGLNMHHYLQFAFHHNFKNKVKTPESFSNHKLVDSH